MTNITSYMTSYLLSLVWNKDSRPVNELRKIRNGPCLAQQKRGGPPQKSTGKVVADIGYGGKEDFSIEGKEGEHTEGMNNVAAAASGSLSSSSSSSAAAALADNYDDDNDSDRGDNDDGDDNGGDDDDVDGDDCETIFSCDEENDEEINDSDNDTAIKEQPVVSVKENTDVHLPAPVPACTSSGTDIKRAVCGVGHVGEEHSYKEAVSASILDTVQAERLVCAPSSCSSGVEGEVVFWHAGETAEEVIEAPTLVEAMSVIKEVPVLGEEEEVTEVPSRETVHRACPMSDDVIEIRSEYDDNMNGLDIPDCEVDCQVNQDVVMKDIDCPIDPFEDQVLGAIVLHEMEIEIETEIEMETEMEIAECAAVDVGVTLDTEATETVAGISTSMQTQTHTQTETQAEMPTGTPAVTVAAVETVAEAVTAPVTVAAVETVTVSAIPTPTPTMTEAQTVSATPTVTPIVTITEAATVTEEITVTATETVATTVIAAAAETETAEEHMDM